MINPLDIAIIVAFLLGGLIGLAFGFIRGGLFVVSWVGSGLATIFGFPLVRPYVRQLIETDWIADLTAGVGLFLIVLVVLFLISSLIGSWVRASRLNALDRSLGMLAGLLTTALIITGSFLVAEPLLPTDNQPDWLKESRSLVLIRASAKLLSAVIPEDALLIGTEKAGDAAEKAREIIDLDKTYRRLVGPETKKPGAPERRGYDSKERRALDRLIQTRE